MQHCRRFLDVTNRIQINISGWNCAKRTGNKRRLTKVSVVALGTVKLKLDDVEDVVFEITVEDLTTTEDVSSDVKLEVLYDDWDVTEDIVSTEEPLARWNDLTEAKNTELTEGRIKL